MKRAVTLLTLLLASASLQAKVTLPALFSDNMILQQQTSAPIWGKTNREGATVTVTTSWDNKSVKAKANSQGAWRVVVETPTYGGTHTITINDGDKKSTVLENVAIGEVWVASGQSNMEMQMSGFNCQPIDNSNRDIALSRDKNLRIMTVERMVAAERTDSVNSRGWSEACSEVVKGTSATAYYFARTMRAALPDMPIGILVSSWGGTSINSWVTPELANSYKDVKAREKKSSPRSQHYPGGLYNGMIHPIAGYASRGFIWYQGESDRMRYQTYTQKMLDMVKAWREAWGDKNMPFYYVQIAPFEYSRGRDGAADSLSPYMRITQAEAVNVIPRSGVAILSDAGMKNCIHPSNKLVVGERLAYQALVKTYGLKGIGADAPIYKSKESKDNTLILTFDNAPSGLTSYGQRIDDFEIAGENGVWHKAGARIRGNTITLSSKEVSEPINARYGFANWFEATLYNLDGIPASTFTTEK